MADKEKLGLDFVDIATQVQSHEELVVLAAAHNLATICQKPFAPDVGTGTVLPFHLGVRQNVAPEEC